MVNKSNRLVIALTILIGLSGLLSNAVAREDVVIILENGARIPARINRISGGFVEIDSKDKSKAYEYGERLSIGEIKGIETSDGEVFSVKHYQEFIAGETHTSAPIIKKAPRRVRQVKLPEKRRVETLRSNDGNLAEIADSIIESGLAPAYLQYLNESGRLSSSEAEMKALIENSPEWIEKVEDLKYVDRIVHKAFSRVYRYQPEDLQSQLDLRFDEDKKMDYLDLMQQLRDRLGSRVSKRDFRDLVDIFGKGGARAIKDIIENYGAWKNVISAS